MSEKQKVDAWMPLWIGAYLADTMELDRHEHGGYLLLLIAYWRNKGPLPDDDRKLANITKCKTKPEWRELRETLEPFFERRDGLWVHGRADIELDSAEKRKTSAIEKASKGGQAKAAKQASSIASSTTKAASSSAPSTEIPASSTSQAVLSACPTPSPTPSPSESSLPADHSSDPPDRTPDGVEPGIPDPPPRPPPEPRPPKLTDPNEIIFGYGVPLLVKAGNEEKHARSFLGGLRRTHGDEAVIDALRNCAREQPLQPLEWLAKALPPKPAAGKQSALEARNAAVAARLLETLQ